MSWFRKKTEQLTKVPHFDGEFRIISKMNSDESLYYTAEFWFYDGEVHIEALDCNGERFWSAYKSFPVWKFDDVKQARDAIEKEVQRLHHNLMVKNYNERNVVVLTGRIQ